MYKKLNNLLITLLITITSYIFNDDPNSDKEFIKLNFWGRYKFFLKQLNTKEVKNLLNELHKKDKS